MKKYIILLLLIIVAIIGYNYIYKDHRDIKQEDAAFSLSAAKLQSDFIEDYTRAEEQYLDQTLLVKGEVTELNLTDLTLDDVVFCSFTSIDNLNVGDIIAIKGRCIGFDDLLEEVKIDQCTKVE